MPNCPQCGHPMAAEHSQCPACGAEYLPATQEKQKVYTESIEAEIIDENEEAYQRRQAQQGSYDQEQGYNGGATWRVHGRGWQQNSAFSQASRELSCLPAFVTLVLGLSLGFQWGFLATLGFFFFYALASALAFGISVRRTLMGKPVLVWFNRILVWIFAYTVAYSLAT